MINQFRILDKFFNWLILSLITLFAAGLLWDTVEAFTNPEAYKFVQYQKDWLKEGFWQYILENLGMLALAVAFWIVALNKLRTKKMLWNRVYYCFCILTLMALAYNLIIKESNF